MLVVLVGPPSPLMLKTIGAIGFAMAGMAGAPLRSAAPALPEIGIMAAPYLAFGAGGDHHGFFDAAKYLEVSPEASAFAEGDARKAVEHFCRMGWREPRSWRSSDEPPYAHHVIAAEDPDDAQILEWTAQGARIAVVVDDLALSARFMAAIAYTSNRVSFARLTKSAAIVASLVEAAACPVVSQAGGTVLGQSIEACLARFGIKGTRPWIDAYLAAAESLALPDLTTPVERSATDLEPDATAIAASVSGLKALGSAQLPTEIVWSPSLFIRLDDAKKPASRTIDLTGPSRGLIGGPYCHLPRGKWTMTSVLSVRDNFQGCKFFMDIYQHGAVNRVLAKSHFILPETGTYEISMECEIVDHRSAVELHFSTEEGLIGGDLDLKEVRFKRAAA